MFHELELFTHCFFDADASGKDKDDVNSRAYIVFKSLEHLVVFFKAYDGWTFKDKKGSLFYQP